MNEYASKLYPVPFFVPRVVGYSPALGTFSPRVRLTPLLRAEIIDEAAQALESLGLGQVGRLVGRS